MKKLIIIWTLACLTSATIDAQDLQLHYDLRHTVSPGANPTNFPTLYFNYWKMRDSGTHWIKPGDFLLKTEADMQGTGDNIGKFFIQIGQSFRAWTPKIFLQFQYSGGGGITQPAEYSYYITNTYQTGVEIPYQWKGAYLTTVLDYKLVAYTKPTNDPIFTQYWYKGLAHYKLEFIGDFSIWTENKNHGDEATAGLKGKRFFFFAEPQLWYNLNKTFAIGSKLNCYYHVNVIANVFQAYPTVAVRLKL